MLYSKKCAVAMPRGIPFSAVLFIGFSETFLKAKSSDNINIKEFISRLNHEMIEREPQTKVFIYKRLKALLK